MAACEWKPRDAHRGGYRGWSYAGLPGRVRNIRIYRLNPAPPEQQNKIMSHFEFSGGTRWMLAGATVAVGSTICGVVPATDSVREGRNTLTCPLGTEGDHIDVYYDYDVGSASQSLEVEA